MKSAGSLLIGRRYWSIPWYGRNHGIRDKGLQELCIDWCCETLIVDRNIHHAPTARKLDSWRFLAPKRSSSAVETTPGRLALENAEGSGGSQPSCPFWKTGRCRLPDTSLGCAVPVSNSKESERKWLSVLSRGGFQCGQVHLDHPHHGFHGFGMTDQLADIAWHNLPA